VSHVVTLLGAYWFRGPRGPGNSRFPAANADHSILVDATGIAQKVSTRASRQHLRRGGDGIRMRLPAIYH
jgi:hypothetical protein